MNKRGLSGVVIAVLLILLAIVAIGIIWGFVNNFLQSSGEGLSADSFNYNLNIEKAELIDDGDTLRVVVKRGSGGGEIGKLRIVVSNEDESESVTTEIGLAVLEKRTFEIPISIIPEKVEVYPVLIGEDGKERIGRIAAVNNNLGSVAEDVTPPANVANLLVSDVASDSITWTWTNPSDSDFDMVLVYFGETGFEENLVNVTVADLINDEYVAIGLLPETEYTIKLFTADLSGNANAVGVSDSEITLA